MREVSYSGAARLLLAAVLTLAIGSSATAQQGESAPAISPFKFDLMRFLFQQTGVEFEQWSNTRRNPSDSIVVLLGDIKDEYDPHLLEFVKQGGAVLIATDLGVRGNNVINMIEGPIRVSDPDDMYQGFDDCFRVPVDPHPITKGVSELVVNRAGSLYGSFDRSRWKTLGWAPDGQIVLSTYERGGARIVAMSDHSPFTNGMLLHGDNAAFTLNVIDWLTESGRRKRISFIVDSHPVGPPNMDPQIPDTLPEIDPADLPEDTERSIFNHFLRELDRENMINEGLAKVLPSHVWRWLLVVASIIAALIIARRLLSSEKPPVKPPSQNPSNASEARAAELLKTGSLRPVAVSLAREFLKNLTGSADPSGWAVRDRDLQLAENVGAGRKIRADVMRLAQLAIYADRRPFRAKELRRLSVRIDFLNNLLQSEQLKLRRPEGQLEFAM